MKFKKYTPTNISTFSKSQLSASLDLHAKNSSSEINYPESDEMSRYLQEMGKKYEAKLIDMSPKSSKMIRFCKKYDAKLIDMAPKSCKALDQWN